jgi:hypothetical protein
VEESSEPNGSDDKKSQKTQNAGRLFKIQPANEYFVQKCMSCYNQQQELSLEEAMIPR